MLRCLLIITLSLFISGAQLAQADTAFTKRTDVQDFINMMVKKNHFQREDLVRIFDQVKYHAIVVQHVKTPLEAKPWSTYQRLFVNEWRIKNGVKFWDKHAASLKKAETIYGVPASIIVATLGVETKYGERTGEYRVIDSLTSLGFSESPRAPFFRKELEQFFLLTREQHLNPMKITGSYAGAIGMPQFIPSSYRYYAASFTKKTNIDLNDPDDVIASIANYYKENGWTPNEPVAVMATVNESKYSLMPKPATSKQKFQLKTLEKYGVTPVRPIADQKLNVKLITLPSGDINEYWIGFHNFDVIKRYNPNDQYAMAVYQLSYYIRDLKERK
jgi:membrane-bound lytic murein transglycosylase B